MTEVDGFSRSNLTLLLNLDILARPLGVLGGASWSLLGACTEVLKYLHTHIGC